LRLFSLRSVRCAIANLAGIPHTLGVRAASPCFARHSGRSDAGGDRLANFATGKGISPFVSNELMAVIEKPIRFRHLGARKASRRPG
jgi:hypothetical protein